MHDDGGPAFPVHSPISGTSIPGMSLWDAAYLASLTGFRAVVKGDNKSHSIACASRPNASERSAVARRNSALRGRAARRRS